MSMPGSNPSAFGTAPGKVILLGEHAVVYGRTALAAAIDRYVTVRIAVGAGPEGVALSEREPSSPPIPGLARAAELLGIAIEHLTVHVTSDLPMGVGLGSSAALSVALVRGLSRLVARDLDDLEVCAHAFEIEKIFHGFPSGIDNTVATFGGLIAFTRGAAPRALAPACPIPLVIALGRAPRQTRQTVTALRQRWTANPDRYEALFDEIDVLVTEAKDALVRGDVDRLAAVMSINHALLRRLGVSTAELDHLVDFARAHGGRGAKLTGGGGGGAVICLCKGAPDLLVQAFEREGWRAFTTEIHGPRGRHASHTDNVERQPVA